MLYGTDLAYVHDAGFSDLVREAAPGVVRLLRRRGIRSGHVVEFGCGGGRLAEHLVEAGYEVTGIDVSRAMIGVARERVPAARFRVGSLTEARIPPCRAVVAVGEVVSYVAERSARPRALAGFFARAFAALEPGGVLVFDFIETGRGRTGHGRIDGEDWSVEWRTTVRRAGRALRREITTTRLVAGKPRRATEVHDVRVYAPADIAGALAEAGFRVIMRRSYGRHRLPPGDVVCVAAKPRRRTTSGSRLATRDD